MVSCPFRLGWPKALQKEKKKYGHREETEILLLLTLFYPHILTHKISLLLSPTACLAAKFLTNLVPIGRKKTCYPTTVRTELLTPWHGTINTAFYKNTVMSNAHILFHTSSALQTKHFNSSGFNWKLWCMLLSTIVRINRRDSFQQWQWGCSPGKISSRQKELPWKYIQNEKNIQNISYWQ